MGGSCRIATALPGLALRVMLTHQPESQAIQSNLQQVLILHI